MSDQQIKEVLSKYLYSIQDASLQKFCRHMIFIENSQNWQNIWEIMKEYFPELKLYEK